MKLLIVSAAPLIKLESGYGAYAPYVKELELLAEFCDEMTFCCPVWDSDGGLLIQPIDFKSRTVPLTDTNITTFRNSVHALRHLFSNLRKIYGAMRAADHIHIRCPGNVGLLACLVQILFPKKKKSAKYAGNWDMKSAQPLSYRLQKWLLNNTILTKNMKVLVYGHWPGASKNIIPFFTASYNEEQKRAVPNRTLAGTIKFLFVGVLSPGKRPLYAVQLVEKLSKRCNVRLDLYGEGSERAAIEEYIAINNLGDSVHLHGNKDRNIILEAYRSSHFIILASKSEGWPKAVAEAMFWGCVPLVTDISCVADMIGHGSRGMLLELNKDADAAAIAAVLQNEATFQKMANDASNWSQQYTVEKFESELKRIIEC